MLHASARQHSHISQRPCSTRWLSQHLLRLLQQDIHLFPSARVRLRLAYPRRSPANPFAQFTQMWLALSAERRFAVLGQVLMTLESSSERERLLANLAENLAQTAAAS